MANRYGNLTPSKKISEDFQNINIGFDRVQADMDANKTAADGHIANADIHVTKAQKAEWDSKAAGGTATELTSHIDDQVVHVTQADHDKLDSIEDGAEVNQNAFAKVNDIAAADPSSQFYIVGGVGITVTTNPNNGEVTITATGDATPGAHGSTHTEYGADPIPTATLTEGGLLSAAQLAEIVTQGELLLEQGEAITALENRLDTADTSQLTLQPGLQVIKAERDARFNLGSIKGKSEINGQGRIGIIGVENPYVIRYGANLLPPFYEYVLTNSPVLDSAYQMRASTKGIETSLSEYWLPVISGATYSFSRTLQNGSVQLFGFDAINGNPVKNMNQDATNGFYTVSFTIPSTVKALRIRCYAGTDSTESVFSDLMLTLGTEAKPFKSREDSMLAFQTELHANPTDGTEPDVLFEQNGQYFKLAKWKKAVITGIMDGVVYEAPQSFTGYKRIRLRNIGPEPLVTPSYIAFMTKYNGDRLLRMDQSTGAGSFAIGSDSGNYLLMHISSADTGWGDAYTPTADEIKAYFNGWRMCNGNNGQLYTGATGEVKFWGKITDPSNVIGSGAWIGGTTVLPTTNAGSDSGGRVYTPYNLLYRLAKETVEPVVSEGCLTLSEGDNVVEVGTGIVLRERANVVYDVTYQNYLINDPGALGSMLKYKTNQLITVNKERKDFNWRFMDNGSGGQRAVCPMPNFDQSASYSVTYLKLDKSPVVPITGVVAVNEKAQLSDLTAGVAEALHRVSVLFNEKAGKDAPGWITLTLLNAWIVYGGYPTLCIRKDSNNLSFDGLIKGGVYSPGTTIAHLPDGYSPRVTKVVSVPCLTGEGMYSIAHLFIRSDGTIAIFSAPGNEYLSFAELSIPLN